MNEQSIFKYKLLSPLFRMAVLKGVQKAVLHHINQGDDVNSVDDKGHSLLMLAASRGHLDICRILLEAGANPRVVDSSGNDVISIALNNGNTDLAVMLRKHLHHPPDVQCPVNEKTQFPSNVPLIETINHSAQEDADWDMSVWVAEDDDSQVPPQDMDYFDIIKEVHKTIVDHVPIDWDDDWSDIDIDLPSIQGQTWREFAFYMDSEEIDRQDWEWHIRVNCYPVSAGSGRLEDGAISILTAVLTQQNNDPFMLYKRDISFGKHLSRLDETKIGMSIECGLEEAFNAIAKSTDAINEILKFAEEVEGGCYSSQKQYMIDRGFDVQTDYKRNYSSLWQEKVFISNRAVDEDIVSKCDCDEESAGFSAFMIGIETVRKLLPCLSETTYKPMLDALKELRLSRYFLGFLRDVLGNSGLDPKAYKSLSKALNKMDEGRNQMIEANLILVFYFARKYYMHQGLELPDLIQEGNIGLIKAVERFDYRRGFRFSTYATWWIRQSITRAIADQARLIRVPVHMVDQINKISQVREEIELRTGSVADIYSIAAHLSIPSRRVSKVLQASQEVVSIETPIPGDDDLVYADLIESSVATPDHYAMKCAMRETMDVVLNSLPPKQSKVLRLRYGFDDEKPHTLEEIGQIFGVTRERIRQIEAKALRNLNHPSRLKILRNLFSQRLNKCI